MPKPTPMPGGDLEYAVLVALWEHGPATARALHARVGEPQALVYTTVAKVLDRLVTKALVERERVGKAFVFRARVTRHRVERSRATAMLAHLLGSGSPPPVAALVEAFESVDPDLLEALAVEIARRRGLA